MRPGWLRKDAWIQRKPAGYACKVVKVDEEAQRALIHDSHQNRSFWVGFRALETHWQGVAS